MKTNFLKFSLCVALLGLFVISCDENLLDTPTIDQRSAQDNSGAELGVARVFENVNNYGFTDAGTLKSGLSGDVVASWDATHTVLTLTFSGSASGTITVAFSVAYPTYAMNNVSATITFGSYVNEGVGINGTIIFTMINGIGGANNPKFSMVANDWVTFTEGSSTSTWKGTRFFEWQTGWSTLEAIANPNDDIYLIWGNTEGVNSAGASYQVNIPENDPLKLDVTCQYGIVDGSMTLIDNPGNDQTSMTVNYGAGETTDDGGACDNWVLITLTSGSTSITARFQI